MLKIYSPWNTAAAELELGLNYQTLVTDILLNHCHSPESSHLMSMYICIFHFRIRKLVENIADKCNIDFNIIDIL